MTISVQNNLAEIPIKYLQMLFKESNPLKRVDIVFEHIFKLEVDKFEDYDRALAYKQWSEDSLIQLDKAPLDFKIGKRIFKTNYIDLGDDIKIPSLLKMHLGSLIELTNLEIDIDSYKAFDNVTALMYREDWSKPFSYQEYLKNALFFNSQKSKYSIWGVQKMDELFKTLKDTYPILYEGEQEGKSDGRKMTDLKIMYKKAFGVSEEEVLNEEINAVFEWMENEKIDHLKKKLKQG